jgi:transposase
MNEQKQRRRHYSAEQKAAIVRRHLVDKVPVSDLCDEYGIQPSVFYHWQKVVLDGMESAFERQSDPGKPKLRERDLERRVAELEARLAKKDSVIAEISEEFVKLKKELGEP